ncbi:MAG: polyhydroxyalkanoate depolymerase, partial [Planctomycetaceae bacterium]
MWKSMLLTCGCLLLSTLSGFADDDALQSALKKAGDNRAQLEQALAQAPADQQAGMKFLIENMPDTDLQSLSADFLLENSRLTWQALQESAWADKVPQDIIFDSLLPYANINERRDAWRKEFFEKFRPLVKDAKSPADAAARL